MSYIGRQPQIGNFQICDAISTVNNQAAYTMQVGSVNVIPETANHMIVSLNGVIQAPISSFTVSGSTITFAANLVTGDVINFIQILGDVLDLGVPSDNTVSTAKIVNGAVTSAKLASGVGGVAGITSSANATAMTINSSENIGIGTSSPVTTLDVGGSLSGGQGVVGKEMLVSQTLNTAYNGSNSGSWGGLMLNNNNSSTSVRTATGLHFTHGTSGVAGIVSTSTTSQRADLRFITRGAGNAVADRVIIHDDGVMSASQGVALGVGTANTASNVLDDYEEGTFTPAYAFDSGSVGMNSSSRGDYVKVGNLVHFQIFIATDSTSSPSGDATITGLPFTTGDNTSSSAAIGLLYRFETDFDGDLKVRVGQDSTVLSPFKNASSSTSATRLQGSDLKAGSNTAWNNLHVAGCYSTA